MIQNQLINHTKIQLEFKTLSEAFIQSSNRIEPRI
jgi:hypothetical protein